MNEKGSDREREGVEKGSRRAGRKREGKKKYVVKTKRKIRNCCCVRENFSEKGNDKEGEEEGKEGKEVEVKEEKDEDGR